MPTGTPSQRQLEAYLFQFCIESIMYSMQSVQNVCGLYANAIRDPGKLLSISVSEKYLCSIPVAGTI